MYLASKQIIMPRITSDITEELKNDIEELAKKNIHSFSLTVSLLLQQAIKERNRKKKNVKENNTEHNSSDTR